MAVDGAFPLCVRDLAGRTRGQGFLADPAAGTVVTTHEAVDGLARLLLHTPGGGARHVRADAVTPLPEWDLALIDAPGIDAEPRLIGGERPPGSAVRVRLDAWTDSVLLAGGPATYTATDRLHRVAATAALPLPSGRLAALRLNAAHSGSPVIDSATGAVVAVLGTALHRAGRTAGLAVPLRAAAERGGPLADLLRRNGRAVPGFGADLNPAGLRALTAATLTGAPGDGGPDGGVGGELAEFEAARAQVLPLAALPGDGRARAVAAYAVRRQAGGAPTVWLRAADLRAGDRSLRDALARVLPGVDPDVAARTARDDGRPLLVVLDAPGDVPAARLPGWVAASCAWLRTADVRLVLVCSPALRADVASAHRLDGVVRRIVRAPGCGASAGEVTERLREAARRSVGTGALGRRAFEALFPASDGCGGAVLGEGVMRPEGAGYRFVDGEFADWLHAPHLDLDATLAAAARGAVARDRAGTVVQAMLHLARRAGADALRRRLRPLAEALDAPGDTGWWARHLLHAVPLGLPEAAGLLAELRWLADRIGGRTLPTGPFGPAFWRGLRLPDEETFDLLRRLLPADGPGTGGERYLSAAAALLAAAPEAGVAAVCRWFGDERPLRCGSGPAPGELTVATAAQALLYAHRGLAPAELAAALAGAAHPRADELLTELAADPWTGPLTGPRTGPRGVAEALPRAFCGRAG
ncbi:hypothetical protein [Streptomyces avicenniae]|uniref:hypothetical protein n=1 Tax=Streptomyces avicenniae TaxID=500153 RepID=UPI00069C387A|nr:hypothetical protein [Streptomyces avicenniae]